MEHKNEDKYFVTSPGGENGMAAAAMLEDAKRTLRWRIRPLLRSLFDTSQDLLSAEAILLRKVLERQILATKRRALFAVLGFLCLLLGSLTAIAAIVVAIVSYFPNVRIEEVSGIIAAGLLGVGILLLGCVRTASNDDSRKFQSYINHLTRE